MAKQPQSGETGKHETSAEAEVITLRFLDLKELVTTCVAAAIAKQPAPVVAPDPPRLVVNLINGRYASVTMPDLPDLGDPANDKRLDALAAIVRLSDVHAPAFYRLNRSYSNDPKTATESRQVKAS